MKQFKKNPWSLVALCLSIMSPKLLFAADTQPKDAKVLAAVSEPVDGFSVFMTDKAAAHYDNKNKRIKLSGSGYYSFHDLQPHMKDSITAIEKGLAAGPIESTHEIDGSVVRKPEIKKAIWMTEFSNIDNFFLVTEAPIEIDVDKWPNVEAYFQAQKFIHTRHEDSAKKKLQAVKSSNAARIKASDFSETRADWKDGINVVVMERAMLAKFSQNDDLKKLLMSTDEYALVYFEVNAFWGCGVDGNGKNILGEIAMRVRKTIADNKVEHRDRELRLAILEADDKFSDELVEKAHKAVEAARARAQDIRAKIEELRAEILSEK